jgi:hypothetical protein
VAVATQLLPGGVGDHATALAAQTLNRAANIVANRPDPPIPAGQYQYIRVHSWNMGGADSAGGGSTVAVLQESIREVWRPSRYTEQWLERRTITGRRKVILGTRRQVRAAGLLSPVPAPIVWRARCAGYGSSRPCAGSADRGGWDVPTPQWIATLPRGPRELYARLRRDALIDGHDDAHMLVTAADALRSGLLPADVRAALYRALTYVPHLDVTARTANLDGVSGTALGMNSQDSGSRLEIIVDPATGRFIGERETQIDSVPGGLQAGTLIRSSSVSTTIVGRQGTRPDPRP